MYLPLDKLVSSMSNAKLSMNDDAAKQEPLVLPSQTPSMASDAQSTNSSQNNFTGYGTSSNSQAYNFLSEGSQ